MEDRAEALTAQQEEALMSFMFEERRDFDFTDDYLDDDQFFEVDWSNESFEKFRGEFERLQGKVSDRAKGILTPGQLQIFNENQVNFRDSYIERKKMEIRALSSK